MNKVLADYWPVIFRGFLYFFIAALPVALAALQDVVRGTVTAIPNYYWWFTAVSAIYQGLVALRAFFDGSVQRNTDRLVANGTPKTP